MRTCSFDSNAQKLTLHQNFYNSKSECGAAEGGNTYESNVCRVSNTDQDQVSCTDAAAEDLYGGIKGVTVL